MLLINEPELARASESVITKVWGAEFVIENNDKYCCKFLKINPGYRSSIHMHRKKDETFIGIMGTAILSTYSSEGQTISSTGIVPGVKHRIAPNTYHSFEAQTATWVMEISTKHSDDDVVRMEKSKNLNA
jgi:mannose-6-phosphate isomerase-like protein (cupin superfamily)